jgi:hypothetical protein
MRAWRIDRLGGKLRYTDMPIPEAKASGSRVCPVVLKGDVEEDAAALRNAPAAARTWRSTWLGNAKDPNSTLAALGTFYAEAASS